MLYAMRSLVIIIMINTAEPDTAASQDMNNALEQMRTLCAYPLPHPPHLYIRKQCEI